MNIANESQKEPFSPKMVLRKHHSYWKLFGPFYVVLFAKTRNAVIVCALRAGLFFLEQRRIEFCLRTSRVAFRTRATFVKKSP